MGLLYSKFMTGTMQLHCHHIISLFYKVLLFMERDTLQHVYSYILLLIYRDIKAHIDIHIGYMSREHIRIM